MLDRGMQKWWEASVSTCCCLIWEHNKLPNGLLQGGCQIRHLLPCQLP